LKKLVAYLTTGYPDIKFTEDLAFSLKDSGVDMLELGIPFSDPVADGPIIEKANLKSLQNGFKMDDLFDLSSSIAPHIDTLWMGYFNPFYQKGIKEMAQIASSHEVKGFIIPDLPFEEANLYVKELSKSSIPLISFVAPTDSSSRIETIVKDAKKFIYLVAYAGITGSGASEDLSQTISNIRRVTDADIFVGFGVNVDSAKDKVKGVDGVIVGSEFIKVLLDDGLNHTQKIKKISAIAREIKDRIN
jgi:tryptophan synthase alpha chain